MSWRIAFLTGRSYAGKPIPPGQVPELENVSFNLIAEAGASLGLSFDMRYWDDEALADGGYDAAIIRTCWDYQDDVERFVSTLMAHEHAGLPVFNGSGVVRWNARKTYLRDLGDAALPTIWLDEADAASVARAFDALDAAEIVVKPQIGASARETVRLKRNAWSEADLRDGPKGAAMIQSFVRSIASEGEWSLFWFGGEYSHAIRKIPPRGDWLANVPGRTLFVAEPASRALRETAETALSRAARDFLYVRVDLVLGDDGCWRVMEIEAIEPYLYLDFAPEGAVFFAKALAGVLSG